MLILSVQRSAATRASPVYPLFQRARLLPIVRRSLKHVHCNSPAEITLRLVDETEGRSLNHSYRDKDYATNVLTFDYACPPQAPTLLADLVFCAPVIEREAVEQDKLHKDHLAHLVVHGVLHALGYDHETSQADALQMEQLEIEILASLNHPNPYR